MKEDKEDDAHPHPPTHPNAPTLTHPHRSEAVIKLLMERDATLLDAPNKNLDTPLMMAVLARNHMAARCVDVYLGWVSFVGPSLLRTTPLH